jgi:hypothetical protein
VSPGIEHTARSGAQDFDVEIQAMGGDGDYTNVRGVRRFAGCCNKGI